MSISIGKIIKAGDSLAVIIPRDTLRALGWKKGDRVAIIPETRETLRIGRITDAKIIKEVSRPDIKY